MGNSERKDQVPVADITDPIVINVGDMSLHQFFHIWAIFSAHPLPDLDFPLIPLLGRTPDFFRSNNSGQNGTFFEEGSHVSTCLFFIFLHSLPPRTCIWRLHV